MTTNWFYNKLSSSHHGHRETFIIENNIVYLSPYRQIFNVPTKRYYDIVRPHISWFEQVFDHQV